MGAPRTLFIGRAFEVPNEILYGEERRNVTIPSRALATASRSRAQSESRAFSSCRGAVSRGLRRVDAPALVDLDALRGKVRSSLWSM
jgi:hypothetical protein